MDEDAVKIEKVDIKKLELNEGQIPGLPKNPRLIKDSRYKALVKSIQDDPEMLDLRELIIFPQGDKYVTIGGNMRLLACRELKFKSVPCKILPEDTPAEKLKAYAIKDNIQGGEWDLDMLANDWETPELLDFGFDEMDLGWVDEISDDDFDGKTDEDEVPEPPKVAVSKPGDLWILGRHRLLCGDATKKEDVEWLMDGKKADMVFTDPPFDFKDINELIKSIDLISENTNILMMLKDKTLVDYLKISSFEFRRFWVCDIQQQVFLWVGPLLNHILISHEAKGKPKLYENLQDAFGSIIKIEYRDKLKEDRLHVHQKSVSDFLKFIKHLSDVNDLIVDLFIGSGTTLIACEQTKRLCYSMEIEPINCDIIIQRWEQFTGLKAELSE